MLLIPVHILAQAMCTLALETMANYVFPQNDDNWYAHIFVHEIGHAYRVKASLR